MRLEHGKVQESHQGHTIEYAKQPWEHLEGPSGSAGRRIVNAYGECEQATGLFTMIEDHLALPFTTEVLGVEITVVKVDLNDRDDVVAICKRGKERQLLSILDLPLPNPPPEGWEWIEAYRHWVRG